MGQVCLRPAKVSPRCVGSGSGRASGRTTTMIQRRPVAANFLFRDGVVGARPRLNNVLHAAEGVPMSGTWSPTGPRQCAGAPVILALRAETPEQRRDGVAARTAVIDPHEAAKRPFRRAPEWLHCDPCEVAATPSRQRHHQHFMETATGCGGGAKVFQPSIAGSKSCAFLPHACPQAAVFQRQIMQPWKRQGNCLKRDCLEPFRRTC